MKCIIKIEDEKEGSLETVLKAFDQNSKILKQNGLEFEVETITSLNEISLWTFVKNVKECVNHGVAIGDSPLVANDHNLLTIVPAGGLHITGSISGNPTFSGINAVGSIIQRNGGWTSHPINYTTGFKTIGDLLFNSTGFHDHTLLSIKLRTGVKVSSLFNHVVTTAYSAMLVFNPSIITPSSVSIGDIRQIVKNSQLMSGIQMFFVDSANSINDGVLGISFDIQTGHIILEL